MGRCYHKEHESVGGAPCLTVILPLISTHLEEGCRNKTQLWIIFNANSYNLTSLTLCYHRKTHIKSVESNIFKWRLYFNIYSSGVRRTLAIVAAAEIHGAEQET